VPLEEVADVLGHSSTRVTSATYRHKTTATVEAGARPMEQILGASRHDAQNPPRQWATGRMSSRCWLTTSTRTSLPTLPRRGML